jgi:hypothetical protein
MSHLNVPEFVCVPVSSSLYNELVLRMGDPNRGVTHLIEHAIESYLDRTEDDEWSDAYQAWKETDKPAEEFRKEFGDPASGYHWTPLVLPNGTKIMMTYGGTKHVAEVRHERIFLANREVSSPSVLASQIAAGTNRNAWRDLWIRRPKDLEYRLADELRREGARK